MRAPGDKVDRYEIEAVLGRGGMGEVYEALDTRLGRKVALKLIPPGADPVANERMIREARAAAAIEHPNAVVVYDVGEAGGETYLAMELVRGASLRSFVGDASVPMGRRVRWLVDVARALGAAHGRGLVHRDVKPDNVMIRDDGAVKVLDFGIARRGGGVVDPSAPTEAGAAALSTLTERGVILGTPRYAAPEQLRGEALDGRADEFSWAVMAYELLSGALPWGEEDNTLALLSRVLSADPPPLAERAPDVPPPAALAVTRALSKRPDDRFPTIGEAADAIEPFADAPTATGTVAKGAMDEARAAAATPSRPTTIVRVARGTGLAAVGILAIVGGLLVALVAAAALFGGTIDIHAGGPKSADAGARPTVVPAVACEDAALTGEGSSPELARAIGRGACARLASELDVDWAAGADAPKLAVTAALSEKEATVALSIAGKRAEGKGPTPLDAIVAASSALAKEVAPPPMSEAAVRSWGAADEAGARRIERVWRGLVLRLLPNDEAAVKALVASDPGSAWSHMIFAVVRPRGTAESKAEIDRARSLAGALPPARADIVRATLLVIDPEQTEEQRRESLRLLQRAYNEAPDDPDVMSLYTTIAVGTGREEEGFALLDRLVARFPTLSVLALTNALVSDWEHDLARNDRYLAGLRALLPESFAWEISLRNLVAEHRLDDARAALEFGRRFGLSGSSLDGRAAVVDLASLSPAPARERASALLADPRIDPASLGATVLAASYYLEGRVAEGEDAELREVERQRGVGSPLIAALHAMSVAGTRRRLGEPPPDADVLAAFSSFAEDKGQDAELFADAVTEDAFARARTARGHRPGLRADEPPYAPGPQEAKATLSAALDRIRARLRKEREPAARAALQLASLPLVRAVEGDAAAVDVWLGSARAPFGVRRGAALDAALALAAAGKRDDAERAYRLAMDPSAIEWHALEAMIARARLAELLRGSGRAAEAAPLDAAVNRLWAKADPGLREAVKKMK